MKVSELMQGRTPSADYEGWITNDDWVLAVDSTGKATNVEDFTVVQMGIAGLDAQMNPVTQDKQYIRTGQNTTKTGTQRTFKVSGDRYIGDAFQDYCFGTDILFGTGNDVIVPYVYFNIKNGKGEKGQVSIIVNSDGGGNAGENSAIDIDLKKTGALPEAYTYSAT